MNPYPSKCIQSNEGNIDKNCKNKSFLGLDSSEDIHNFTNRDISESNTRCKTFIR